MPAAIEYRLTGGAANSDPNASLGGASSSVAVSGTALNNIFDDVTPAEALTGKSEYRAIDIRNTGDANAVGVETFMDPITSSADTQLDFGIEASPLNSVLAIADEDTAPAGVSFTNYTTGSRLTLPDIPNGEYCRLWLRRVVGVAAGNDPNDSGDINVEFA